MSQPRTEPPTARGRVPPPARREPWAATAAAIVLLAATGIGYRALARHLERGPARPPLPPGTLAQLPLKIGVWTGRDEPVETAVIRAADVDDYVNRRYVRRTDLRPVGLWVACGGRARDLMPHRPEVCYPGAGWTLLDRTAVEVTRPDGGLLPARLLTFATSGLAPRRLTVLNFYIVDGETCADVSLLRSKAWRGQTAIRYMVQVQITCEAQPGGLGAEPGDIVQAFAAELFGPLYALLQDPGAGTAGTKAASGHEAKGGQP